MAAPVGEEMRFADLVHTAQLLQAGLEPDAAIAEVFSYLRHTQLMSTDTTDKSPLKTLQARIGGCGSVNGLMATLLELNGLRTREVSGFHPVYRVFTPGGGHSAIEVYHKSWRYTDPYLDIDTRVPAADLKTSKAGRSLIWFREENSRLTQLMRAHLGKASLTLANLFHYRVYSDDAGRLPSAYLTQLKASEGTLRGGATEASYGMDWPLRQTGITFNSQDVPEAITVYIRARHMISTCPMANLDQPACSDENAVATPWGMTQITVRPRHLLREALAPRAAKPE